MIYKIAEDIVKVGLSPLERLGVVADKTGTEDDSLTTYIVVEGNRRICALKLLNDPDLAPSRLVDKFNKLASEWQGIDDIEVTVFPDKNAAKEWIRRNHGGQLDGVGRKPWNAEQKARFTGKNQAAQGLLDYAAAKGFISENDRRHKLTTVARFISNPSFASQLGFKKLDNDLPARNRPAKDFDDLLRQFMDDLAKRRIDSRTHSRANKIEEYGHGLVSKIGPSSEFLKDPKLLDASNDDSSDDDNEPSGSNKPNSRSVLPKSQQITEKLLSLENRKLDALYTSLCGISLRKHSVLLSVGLWAFFECLARQDGARTDFKGYFSGNLLSYGLTDRDDNKAMNQALERISKHGNTSKHHQLAATFDGQQLANDLQVLEPLIVTVLDRACGNKFVKR